MFPMMHYQLFLICCVTYSVIWPSSAYQCGQYERPVECIDQCQTCEYRNGGCAQPAVCIPGCDCIPGFFRNKQKQCIPAAFCPGQCKSDEQFYPDIPDCKNTCEYINNPGTICPQYYAPRPGCFCKKGLVKSKDGKCVKPENCGPPPRFPCLLDVNAGPCHGYFPRFYFNKKTGQCEKFIYGGCEGNANNFEDKKICEIVCKGPPQPQQCPAGEIPVECIDRCQRCEYKNGNCSQILICTPGCNCLPGFLRDSTNKCIPADFCPGTGPGPAQQCPAGEIPVECIDRCQRCEYKNGNCVQAQVCTPGCNCLPGFLRDSTNKCIPSNFCPDQCKSDEQYYPDIPDCKNTCGYINNPGTICPQYFAPRPGCFCKKDLVKRKDGKCVKPENCGPPGFPCSLEKDAGPCYGYFPRFYFNKKTGQCEEFIYGGCEGNANNFEDKKLCEIVCKGPGPTQQCGQYERPVECIDQCQTCEYRNGGVCAKAAVCIPGCDCIPGFFRNKQKQCIPAAFCPGTGPGPAQQCPAYEYPVPCIDKCQTCEYKNGHCIQTAECTPGCNCVPGFLRDSTKKCIPASRCP